MTEFSISSMVFRELKSRAHAAHPHECCGILLGNGTQITAAIPAKNAHPDPETHFEIDPQALIDAHRAERKGGPQIAGYYHSHPNGLARPSEMDRKSAAHDGKLWAIIAEAELTFWRDDPDGFVPLSYSVGEA